MRIAFVHTPMSTVSVPQRQEFWRSFDVQYHASHPGLRPMRRVMWELPHWMLWLAGVLDDNGYDDLDVVDLYTEDVVDGIGPIRHEPVRQLLRAHAADCYLFSPMTVNLGFAYDIAEVIKQLYPEAKVIFGGVVATPLCDEVARHPAVDYVVVERAEVALPALLRAIESDVEPVDVGQLVFQRSDRTLVRTAKRYPDVHPSALSFPKVDLFPASAGQDIRYLRQVYGLGCPYKCTFCTIQTIGRKPDFFPIDRVLAEIRAYRARYGEHHHIYWGDETFTLHPARTMELLTALRQEGGITYDCQTRLNCLNDDRMLHEMKASGCQWLEIGLETGVQDSHEVHKHHMKLDDVEETLKRVRDAGIAACSFMVNGLPAQTPDDMRRSVDWVCDLISRDLLQASYLFGLVPYPGSAMFTHPERFGMTLLHRDFSRYHEDLPPVFTTPQATPDAVYTVFLESLELLGQAMSKRPYFGSAAPDPTIEYGAFWAGAHV
jgi:anaerobic magnesium-protoporphyrin IX monomethyl ester cyclase